MLVVLREQLHDLGMGNQPGRHVTPLSSSSTSEEAKQVRCLMILPATVCFLLLRRIE